MLEDVFEALKSAGLVFAGTGISKILRNFEEGAAPFVFAQALPGLNVRVSNALHASLPAYYGSLRSMLGAGGSASQLESLIILGIAAEGFGKALEDAGVATPF